MVSPRFLVNSGFCLYRDLCECPSSFVCVCEMLANSGQTNWGVVWLAGIGAGYGWKQAWVSLEDAKGFL